MTAVLSCQSSHLPTSLHFIAVDTREEGPLAFPDKNEERRRDGSGNIYLLSVIYFFNTLLTVCLNNIEIPWESLPLLFLYLNFVVYRHFFFSHSHCRVSIY